jgi:hypothetical protein
MNRLDLQFRSRHLIMMHMCYMKLIEIQSKQSEMEKKEKKTQLFSVIIYIC